MKIMSREEIGEMNEEAMFLGIEFDGAIAGYVEQFGTPVLALYDRDKVISILVQQGMKDQEEAAEWFEFNILGAFVGNSTPAFASFFEEEKETEDASI